MAIPVIVSKLEIINDKTVKLNNIKQEFLLDIESLTDGEEVNILPIVDALVAIHYKAAFLLDNIRRKVPSLSEDLKEYDTRYVDN